VDYHTGLIAPFFARLLNVVNFRRCVAAPTTRPLRGGSKAVLTPDDLQDLERIIAEWSPQGHGRPANVHEIVERALRRMQWELDSGYKDEITEDLLREIEYRMWLENAAEESIV
jgi:hypothetical protein